MSLREIMSLPSEGEPADATDVLTGKGLARSRGMLSGVSGAEPKMTGMAFNKRGRCLGGRYHLGRSRSPESPDLDE